MAQGSVSRGHYSNQFDCNDPQLPALALFLYLPIGLIPLTSSFIKVSLIKPSSADYALIYEPASIQAFLIKPF